MKNFTFNKIGTIDCAIEIAGLSGFHQTTLTAESSQKVIDSGVEIAPHVKPIKTAEQLRADIEKQLSALDPTNRMLAGAISGDQWAVDKMAGKRSWLRFYFEKC